MKRYLALIILMAAGFSFESRALAEDWKGEPDPINGMFGALMGLGIVDNQVGFSLLGTASKTIIDHGFVSDINDSVSIEGMAGPSFQSDRTIFVYSAHLRWDFNKDSKWTLFATGGVGGRVASGNFGMAPRFGIGSFLKFHPQVYARADLTHDLVGVGLVVPF